MSSVTSTLFTSHDSQVSSFIGQICPEKLPPTLGYLQWLAFENVIVHRDQT
jgi:hypothetical protein